MSLSRYRHIVWDWNGTLLDDLDLSIDIMNGILARRGLPPLDRTRYHALFDFPVRDYYARLGFDSAADSFEQLSIDFITAYDRRRWESQLHTGASVLLGAIQSAGLTQSILSAYRHQTLCEIVEHFALTPHFVRLTGLDNIYAHSKVELGRAWLEELALPRHQVLLVGDTLHDFEVAQALGIDCVLVAGGHHPAARLLTRTPDVVADLAALAARLELALTPISRAPAPPLAAAFSDRDNPAG